MLLYLLQSVTLSEVVRFLIGKGDAIMLGTYIIGFVGISCLFLAIIILSAELLEYLFREVDMDMKYVVIGFIFCIIGTVFAEVFLRLM